MTNLLTGLLCRIRLLLRFPSALVPETFLGFQSLAGLDVVGRDRVGQLAVARIPDGAIESLSSESEVVVRSAATRPLPRFPAVLLDEMQSFFDLRPGQNRIDEFPVTQQRLV